MRELISGLIDVFADEPLAGNPLAIVQAADELSEEQMRRIASEFNQPRPHSSLRARVRIGGCDHLLQAERKCSAILKSIFLPRILGVLLVLAGLGYLIFLWPSLGRHLFFPYIALPGVIGEGSLTLWLLIIGVNTQRWTEHVSGILRASQGWP